MNPACLRLSAGNNRDFYFSWGIVTFGKLKNFPKV